MKLSTSSKALMQIRTMPAKNVLSETDFVTQCMGLGRNSSRVAARRMAAAAVGEKLTTQLLTDRGSENVFPVGTFH